MMTNWTTPDPEEKYHEALDALLVLWVAELRDKGRDPYDYNAVDRALAALAQRPDLPVSAAFCERVRGA